MRHFGATSTEEAACYRYQSWVGYITIMFEFKFATSTLGGFGQEARDAMATRAEHLVAEGLARPRVSASFCSATPYSD